MKITLVKCDICYRCFNNICKEVCKMKESEKNKK